MGTYTGKVGCLVDGHKGQYAHLDVINIAINYEMPVSDADLGVVKDAEVNGMSEDSQLLSEQAEQYLNDHVANLHHSFGWHGGEFFYMPNNWWEDTP